MIIDKRSDLQDHLGNNRQALIRSGSVLQVTRYYPVALRRLFLAMAELKQVSLCSFGLVKKFGAQYAGSTEISGVNIQPYKYNFSIEREKRKLAFSSEREKNRPKVNGKELDRMHGLDTYDYGARQYNPILGRWDRMDPLCEKYYGVSPYAYCANNPVRYIDPDGRYILSEEQAKKYPRLNQYLQKGIQGILDNPKIMHALRVAGRFNDEQIKEMVTYGKGPIINVEDLHGLFGKYNRGVNSKMLRISEKWVNKLENSKGFDSDVYLFLTAVTILHESSHYGDDLAGEPDGENREDGNIFEKMAYGEIINEDNAKKHVKEYFDKSPHNNSQSKENDE